MTLPEVQARCPGATLLPADFRFYDNVCDRMAENIAMRCPVVEKAEMGCFYTWLEDLAPVYGGEARLIASLLQSVPPDFGLRVGVASGRFTAYVSAATASPGRAVKTQLDSAALLSGHSIDPLISPQAEIGGNGLKQGRDEPRFAAVDRGQLFQPGVDAAHFRLFHYRASHCDILRHPVEYVVVKPEVGWQQRRTRATGQDFRQGHSRPYASSLRGAVQHQLSYPVAFDYHQRLAAEGRVSLPFRLDRQVRYQQAGNG